MNEEVYCVRFFLSTRGNKTGRGGTIMFHPLLLAQHFPRLKGQYFIYQLHRHNKKVVHESKNYLINILYVKNSKLYFRPIHF